MIKITINPKETEKLAGFLLEKFIEKNRKQALVIALEGELGAGKTVFVKGLAKALRIRSKIKSPTFTLIKSYGLPRTSYELHGTSYKFLYHLDCYRLRDHNDLESLGIKEILNNPDNIVVIEWSDRVKKALPEKYIKIHIDHISDTQRKLNIDITL